MVVAVIGTPTLTNDLLAGAWRALGLDTRCVTPAEALASLGAGDTALVRLDVLPSLDGIEPGLAEVEELVGRGIRVLNRPVALTAAHDKLVTARRLAAAGLPHPRTLRIAPGAPVPADVPLPCVVKPRYGSWGADVGLCTTAAELRARLAEVRARSWFERHGALVQALVPPEGRDLRVVVAGHRAIGAVERVAAPGEWRTNASLGGTVRPVDPPPEALQLAVAAAEALGCDLVGVDLLPAAGGHVVLELNGAVDFDDRYAFDERDVCADAAVALGLLHPAAGGARRRPRVVRGFHEPASVGDIVETGGDSPRRAEIVALLGTPAARFFRVRWEDGHESVFHPGRGAAIRRRAESEAPLPDPPLSEVEVVDEERRRERGEAEREQVAEVVVREHGDDEEDDGDEQQQRSQTKAHRGPPVGFASASPKAFDR